MSSTFILEKTNQTRPASLTPIGLSGVCLGVGEAVVIVGYQSRDFSRQELILHIPPG